MQVRIDHKKNVLSVKLCGELDHHSSSLVRNSIDGALSKRRSNGIILNCKQLEFMDSSGLGVILGRYKKIKAMGGDMVACNVSKQVDRLFELSGLKRIIKLYPDEASALQAIEGV